MPGEELIQRGYISDTGIRGERFGRFEYLNLGSTTIGELLRVGLLSTIIERINFPFTLYRPPSNANLAKPDGVFFRRRNGRTFDILAIKEVKKPNQFNTDRKRQKAFEQGLFVGGVIQAKYAIVTDGTSFYYVDIIQSIESRRIVFNPETRSINPGLLEELTADDETSLRNPGDLAEKVWQAIWHATKEEPKQCLMTFVEIFILKFLSDNLPDRYLPRSYSFYELVDVDDSVFQERYGKTKIEYYVQSIRPHIKSIFPDRTIVTNSLTREIFGIETLLSPTSIINGFAFLKSGSVPVVTFNRTFNEILKYFRDFGVLRNIDPEFKMRLYETFLKKTVRQQKLGQFFTPRNVVRAMIKMAKLNSLPENAIIFDPAAGVGGFILEPLIEPGALIGNISFQNGLPKSRVVLLGADCDENTNVLAKSNMLIHLGELLRDPSVSIDGLNKLMADTFLVLNTNQHLGTLEYPVENKFDIILTNPPYVTQGSKIYKDEIAATRGLRNGKDLVEYYDRCGLGLESLFLRYISGALKPGGRAFIIVPQGLLTRTESATKEKILSECNLIASISLPRNTFYSTPQKTYIICLEKRRTNHDHRPDVFCAIATSVGESLDARRVPLENENDLENIAEAFLLNYRAGITFPVPIKNKIKLASASAFTASDRWDVYRFWNDDELVNLGERDEAITRTSFIDEIRERFNSLDEDITIIKQEINDLMLGDMGKITLSDENIFNIRRGKRVTRSDGDEHPGEIPVYSGSKDSKRPICKVSEEWATSNGIPIENSPIITVNANGFVGAVFLRDERCIIHDDVMIIEVKTEDLDLNYLVYALRAAIAEGNYEYEAKLYSRVKDLEIEVPIQSNGRFDVDKQSIIAQANKKFDTLKQQISELGDWAKSSRIKN